VLASSELAQQMPLLEFIGLLVQRLLAVRNTHCSGHGRSGYDVVVTSFYPGRGTLRYQRGTFREYTVVKRLSPFL